MMRRVWFWSVVLVAVGFGLGPAQPPQTGEAVSVEKAAARAREAASAFGQELLATLLSEMKAGGPVKAMVVCSVKAPELARAHSRDGVTVRRVTLKPRNPQNAPDEFERARLVAMLEQHQQGQGAKEVIETVQEGDRTVLRYLRPIVVGETCLKCHGSVENLDPQVRELLPAQYPQDQAVGYRAGDFRGAFSVTVVLDTPQTDP